MKTKINIEKIYNNEFFEILVEHYNMYVAEGLVLPPRFAEETKNYVNDCNVVQKWLDDDMIITGKQTDKIKSSELWNDFIGYYDGNNKGVTQLLLKNTLATLGVSQKRKNDGLYFLGISRKEDVKKEEGEEKEEEEEI